MDDGWRTTRGASALIAVRQPFYGKLVVEETHMGECHGDAILVAGVDDMVVADATASLCDKLHAAAMGTLDVVAEGEESIRSQGHARVLGDPCLALLAGQWFGLLGEELLPCAVAEDVLGLVADIEVDAVVAVCTANLLLEWQVHDLRVLAQPPFVSLASCQSGAVDAALLTSSDTDGLSVLDVADGVALRIFQRDEGDDQVALSLRGERLVLRRNVLEERRVVEAHLVATLLEGDAKHLLALDGGRGVGRVYLDDTVGALALLAEDLQGLWSVAWGYHAVAHLALDEACRGFVANVAQGTEVSIGAHAVGTTRTGVGRGERSELEVHVIDEVNFLQCVVQRQSDGCSRGTDVLERSCGREARSLLQLLDELPTIECVEQVDVSWATAEHLDGQLSLLHKHAGGFLVGVAAVL